ncbi:hypothetical protein TrVE_jg13536 [Triparma verrucosa]|uniref:Uncharacterized protein n=1 Tax=Triparma verrucosa TaxID=1606542 RepID=A0A9W7FI43_9STRA|nr:hypothetical protein TrVE_jg13536 [Triparma verrucosa]
MTSQTFEDFTSPPTYVNDEEDSEEDSEEEEFYDQQIQDVVCKEVECQKESDRVYACGSLECKEKVEKNIKLFQSKILQSATPDSSSNNPIRREESEGSLLMDNSFVFTRRREEDKGRR